MDAFVVAIEARALNSYTPETAALADATRELSLLDPEELDDLLAADSCWTTALICWVRAAIWLLFVPFPLLLAFSAAASWRRSV